MSHSLNKNLYYLYILTLPFSRFVDLPFGEFVNKILTCFSSYVMIIGLILLFFQHRLIYSQRMKPFFLIWFFMTTYSFLASFILLLTSDELIENPLYSCLNDIVLYFLFFLSIYYNYYHLSRTITFKQLFQIFNLSLITLLVIGFLQLGTIFSLPLCGSIYNLFSSVFALNTSEYLISMNRGVTLFGPEPSTVAELLTFYVPFIMGMILYGYRKKYYIFILLLFTLLFILSNSSSVAILYSIVIMLFIYCLFKQKIGKYIFCGSFFLGMSIAVIYSLDINVKGNANKNMESLGYMIYGKLIDKENMSTAMRASTVINDMKIFYDYPLTGIGNGNQCLYYEKNIPFWVTASPEVQNLLFNKYLVNGGGNFFATYFSAFGLIGILVLLLFVKEYTFLYKSSFLTVSPIANFCFSVGVVLFLVSSWYVVGLKNSEMMAFVLSLPLIKKTRII